MFQDYNFTYDSNSISYILKSIEADIVIFTGALDSNFNLKNKSNQASKYMAAITNVIVSCEDLSLKKFIYISSCSVFDGNPELLVTEDTEPIPINDSEKAILMGEEICRSYHNKVNFTINIVRISEIYGRYKDELLEHNICTNICKEAIEQNKVKVYNNRQHNMIYVDDAVDCIYRITKKSSYVNTIYHITSQDNSVYLETRLAALMEDILDKKIQIEIIEPENNYFNHNYQSENIKKLGFNEKYDIKAGMKSVQAIIKKQSTNANVKNKVKFHLIGHLFTFSEKTRSKISPLVENIIFFLLMEIFVILTRALNFHKSVDVYLLYVIIIALIYGYLNAAFAALLSIIGKIYITLCWNSQYISVNENNVYLWILQIFTIGMLVGYLKDKYKRKNEELNDEKDHLQLELKNIKDINNSNIEIRSLYEKRLINYKDSFARIYDIVSKLDAIEPERVIFKTVNVMCEIMNTNDVSIYTCDRNSQFCRLMAASSDKSKKMKKSIKLTSRNDLYIKLNKKEIYVNNTLNPDYPMMAGGTYKDGHLQTIIMIWWLPFENNNLYEMNIFGVLCKLVERTMDRAYEYMENINESSNRKYKWVLNAEAFEKILRIYQYGNKENLIDFSLLKVQSYNSTTEEDFYNLLKGQVRNMDYIGVDSNGKTYILLANSNQDEAKYVVDRLRKNQIIVEIGVEYAN